MRRFLFLLLLLLLLLPVAAPAQQPSHLERKVLEPSVLFDHLSIEDGLSHSWVWSVYQDSRGFLWFGTPDGLNRYDGYSFRIYENGGVLEDASGDLWISTSRGLARLDPDSGALATFGVDDGLASNEFYRGAALRAADGVMLLGSNGGLTAFRPEDVARDTLAPPVVLTDFLLLLNERVSLRRADPSSPLERPILATDEIVLSLPRGPEPP